MSKEMVGTEDDAHREMMSRSLSSDNDDSYVRDSETGETEIEDSTERDDVHLSADNTPWYSLAVSEFPSREPIDDVRNMIDYMKALHADRERQPSIQNIHFSNCETTGEDAQFIIKDTDSGSRNCRVFKIWFAPRIVLGSSSRERFAAMIESTHLDTIIVDKLSVFGRDVREIEERVRIILDAGCEIHVVDSGFVLCSKDKTIASELLKAIDTAGIDIQRKTERVDIEDRLSGDNNIRPGRARLGFDKDDAGRRVPANNYDRVCEVLHAVKYEDLSKSAAARELDVSRKTIHRALGCSELYGIN
ncbi:resolvase domain protein [Natrialba magadii ATCC 43099]|uniref:Resolvase domain protein n=1 Tax=Natrialba magadii (strain ATCC 43099 / DSM 3394 / CCM 3739 / CIP 104546 / IAM 13178 / JCM 8861 / NBRC 102185 / NCIMB 2190 / MS3) TaxID=547559 RepID=D3SXD5_NATMM|nr:recombinase family protein [Natrialba magadii]ADD03955.1 resolvase domain protein [Natrialba magadii ATCC 43099]ELY33618.1 hypothetical protein C500_02260 [Natrialba magadii ATCC 43099]